jgi:murein DD-endopeptidase MepM/ murein hydrolase activator NlpD
MAKWPVAGVKGKAWKVTSKFGWRTHPISGAKKHHNGVDIWQAKEPTPLLACFDGKVIAVSTSTDPNGAGNKVVVQSTVNDKKITWTYFHMVKGSIKVKKGDLVKAGDVVGRMGDTGFSTGKHLHWEIWSGHRTAQPNINGGGKGFYDPMKFMSSILAPKPATTTPVATEAPVTPVEPVVAPQAAIVTPPVIKAFVSLKKGSKGSAVKSLQTALKITADGDFGPITEKAVKAYQTKKGLPVTGIADESTWKRLGL